MEIGQLEAKEIAVNQRIEVPFHGRDGDPAHNENNK
jgi:hypothetical protein